MEITAYVKSVNADLVKKETTLTFIAGLDEETLDEFERLAALDGQPVRLEITPKQMALIDSQ